MKKWFLFNLQMLAEAGTVTNTTDAMSAEMKIFYDTEVLENYREKMIFGQLGKKQSLPANHGKSVEVRKFDTLPDADKLVEAVIPEGKKLGTTSMTMAIDQYGLYVTISDQLDLHAEVLQLIVIRADPRNKRLQRDVAQQKSH